MAPYVVSCDLSLLWERAGVVLPPGALDEFRTAVRRALGDSVGDSEWVSEAEMSSGLSDLLADCSLPVVSLDPVYAPTPFALDLTRLVDVDGQDAGYGLRSGDAHLLESAVDKLAARLPSLDIALVDDVLFSGSMLARLIELFANRRVRVRSIYAGIAIGEGAERLRSLGCAVAAVRQYDEVHDEICERDFLPGAPMSGRTVAGLVATGAPYLLPFGRPGQWASIPEQHERAFSRAVLLASADFYDELGLRVGELPRRILNFTALPDELVGVALRRLAKQL